MTDVSTLIYSGWQLLHMDYDLLEMRAYTRVYVDRTRCTSP